MNVSTEAFLLNVCEALGGFEPVADVIYADKQTLGSDATQQKGRYVLGDECLGKYV
jgi:hypothetical protein